MFARILKWKSLAFSIKLLMKIVSRFCTFLSQNKIPKISITINICKSIVKRDVVCKQIDWSISEQYYN